MHLARRPSLFTVSSRSVATVVCLAMSARRPKEFSRFSGHPSAADEPVWSRLLGEPTNELRKLSGVLWS